MERKYFSFKGHTLVSILVSFLHDYSKHNNLIELKDGDLKDSAHFLSTVLKKVTFSGEKKSFKMYWKGGETALPNKDSPQKYFRKLTSIGLKLRTFFGTMVQMSFGQVFESICKIQKDLVRARHRIKTMILIFFLHSSLKAFWLIWTLVVKITKTQKE